MKEEVKHYIKKFLQKDAALLQDCIEELLEPKYTKLSDTIFDNTNLISYINLKFNNHRDCYIIVCLDEEKKITHHECLSIGTYGDCSFYMRELFKVLFNTNCKYFYIIKKSNMLYTLNDSILFKSINSNCLTLQTGRQLDFLIFSNKEIYSLKEGKIL